MQSGGRWLKSCCDHLLRLLLESQVQLFDYASKKRTYLPPACTLGFLSIFVFNVLALALKSPINGLEIQILLVSITYYNALDVMM